MSVLDSPWTNFFGFGKQKKPLTASLAVLRDSNETFAIFDFDDYYNEPKRACRVKFSTICCRDAKHIIRGYIRKEKNGPKIYGWAEPIPENLLKERRRVYPGIAELFKLNDTTPSFPEPP